MAYPPAPAPVPQPVPVKQGNGFGVTALVLGIIGLVFAFIPIANVFTALPLGILAVIFGIIGLVAAGKRAGKGKGTGGTGLVLGILAIGVTFAMNALVFNEIGKAADDIREQTIQDCVDSGAGTQEECEQIWEDAEDSVYGE
ncbi:hypothetical protein [Glycomyces terrestris]|uniref:DUF4190 domain-containing protein n=1 Tax=Glycomyces terrestris TaxID=2493553 RepID=A0A426UUC8_9ACTN|nr:hypothetical protein [Glycomyces terrestris]RRR97604.1 hypothetical protein EIW28_19655 [Glycomyces terrestris]